MAITGKLYGKYLIGAQQSEIDYINDEMKVMLTTSGYVPDQDVDDFKDDVTNEVPNGGGYTTGGEILAGKTITYDAGTNIITVDATDVPWAAATFTMRNAVVYDNTPAAAGAKRLVLFQASSGDISVTSGTFTIVWAATGLVRITVS